MDKLRQRSVKPTIEEQIADWHRQLEAAKSELAIETEEFYKFCADRKKQLNAQRAADMASVELNTVYKWVQRGKRIKAQQEVDAYIGKE